MQWLLIAVVITIISLATLQGELLCISCASGFYLDQVDKVCRRCPVNSSTWEYTNASLPTDCECEAGFYNGSVDGVDKCHKCHHGAYKTYLGNATCDACMDHANTSGLASKTPADCLCVEGFTLEVPNELDPYLQRCIPCYAGFFKGWLGDEVCDMCPVDHYCVQQSVAPVACPDFSVSLAGAVDVYECTCIEGYYHQYTHGYYSDDLQREIAPSLTCVPCPAGTYADIINTTECAPCPSNTFFNRTTAVAVTDCYECPEHATSQSGSVDVTNCFCDLGYAGDPGDSCVACEPGFYREDLAKYICEACPVHTYNELYASTTQQDCQACPADQRSSTGSGRQLDCVCKNGTFATLSPDRLYWECTPCAAGTYQEAINASSCDACAPGTESTVVEAYDAAVCTQCHSGYYALQPATTSCTACEFGTWQDLTVETRHSEACEACPGNSSHSALASIDIHDCVCADGFVKYSTVEVPNRCDRCRPGSYCPGNGTQVPCPYNFWSPGGIFPGPCIECATHSSALNEGDTVGVHQCQCEPGTEGLYDANCSLCGLGKYQPLDYTYPDGTDFVGGDAISTVCGPCPAGNYSDVEGSTSCAVCPDNSNSLIGSIDITDCVCDPGYHGPDGGSCEVCPVNKFCPGGTAATHCRPNSVSPENVVAEADCKCVPGYYSNASTPDDLTCHKCLPGYYCHDDQHIEACAANSTSPVGSKSVDACSCVPGMWRGCIKTQDGRYLDANGVDCEIQWSVPCVLCDSNDICLNNTLLHCPEHSTAPAGSHDEHACVCDDGYYNVFGHAEDEHDHVIDYEHAH
jgi:hypothetical protein